jgi:hypothetical protein
METTSKREEGRGWKKNNNKTEHNRTKQTKRDNKEVGYFCTLAASRWRKTEFWFA